MLLGSIVICITVYCKSTDAICLHMHCAVSRLCHFSGYYIIALDSFFITTDNRVLFGHMDMHDIMPECVDGNVASFFICFDAFTSG